MNMISGKRDRNISKTCVFIFHHSIQHDEASGYTFYINVVDLFFHISYLNYIEILG